MIPPSTASPLYAPTRAPSNVVRSRTSLSSHLRNTQRGGRNQVGVNGRELGDDSLASTIYCSLYIQTASTIEKSSGQAPKIKRGIQHAERTSPVCDLSCSSNLHGLLYDLTQPEKVQRYFFFAFFISDPFTKTNSVFCFVTFRGFCGGSTPDSSSCQETSLRS